MTIEELKEATDTVKYTKDGKIRRRKPKVKRDYFTQDTEDAIVEYINSKSVEHRENLYNTRIRYSMEKLVECVVNTFSFDYVEASAINLIDVQKETLSHLIKILSGDKNLKEKGGYRPSKGKAYSYFTRTAINHLMWLNKQAYKNLQQKADLEGAEDDSRLKRIRAEEETGKNFVDFVQSFRLFMEQNLYDLFPDDLDRRIAEIFCVLLKNASNLEIFNRKVIYFQIREETRAKTPDITRVLSQIKEDMANQMTIYYRKGGELDVEYFGTSEEFEEYDPVVTKVSSGIKLPKPRWESLHEWPGLFLNYDEDLYDIYTFTSPKSESIPWLMLVDKGGNFNNGLIWEGKRLNINDFTTGSMPNNKVKYTLIDGRRHTK